MSTRNAEMYGRRARDADDTKDLGYNVKKAIEELTREIKNLASRLARLEAKQR